MRTGTIAKALLLLLLAWSAAVSAAKDPAEHPDAPRPTPARPPTCAASRRRVCRTRFRSPCRTASSAGAWRCRGASSGTFGQQAAIMPAHAAASRPCGRCGCCRRNAECGQMPFGAAVCAAMKTQICNGLGARMVLYHYDFCDAAGADGDKLNEHGMARLRDIARMFQCSNFHPIVIEYTPCNVAARCGAAGVRGENAEPDERFDTRPVGHCRQAGDSGLSGREAESAGQALQSGRYADATKARVRRRRHPCRVPVAVSRACLSGSSSGTTGQ